MAFTNPFFPIRLNAKTTNLDFQKTYLVGVAIFRINLDPTSASKHQLLIIKRAPDEDSFPDMWEIPGGHIEQDETILQCIQRETREETGLVVEKVLKEFEEMDWESGTSGQENMQLNFVVAVQEPVVVRLNPEEHSEWMWVEENQIDKLPMTIGMTKVLRDAFKVSKIVGLL